MAELQALENAAKCDFCGLKANDYLRYGPMYELGKIKAHYFCVLLSNRLIQRGGDHEGILGFLLTDIRKELKRSSSTACCYCGKKSATIKCAFKQCRKSFHLPCGVKKNTCHQFFGEFKSFCHLHSYDQNIPADILKDATKEGAICCICHDAIHSVKKHNILWAPCCMKTWYHKFCLQQLAYSAGYFFKCATCNDVKKFTSYVQRFGIFVPQQDASWERVPNAFSELLFRYGTCDAEVCCCPHGRKKNAADTEWEVVVCCTCGSQGIHVECGSLKHSDVDWECDGCLEITKKMADRSRCDSPKEGAGSSKIVKVSEVGRLKRRSSDDLENFVLDKRKKSRITAEEDDEEAEIDVETVDEKEEEEPKPKSAEDKVEESVNNIDIKNDTLADLQKVMRRLRPGPLSYKLSVIHKVFKKEFFTEETERPTTPPVIDLTGNDIESIGETSSVVEGETDQKDCEITCVKYKKNAISFSDSIDDFNKVDPKSDTFTASLEKNISQPEKTKTTVDDAQFSPVREKKEAEVMTVKVHSGFEELEKGTEIANKEIRILPVEMHEVALFEAEAKDGKEKKTEKDDRVNCFIKSETYEEITVCENKPETNDTSYDNDVIIIN